MDGKNNQQERPDYELQGFKAEVEKVVAEAEEKGISVYLEGGILVLYRQAHPITGFENN